MYSSPPRVHIAAQGKLPAGMMELTDPPNKVARTLAAVTRMSMRAIPRPETSRVMSRLRRYVPAERLYWTSPSGAAKDAPIAGV